MNHSSSDTIVALATPMGRSGVAVVRLSGPAARDAVKAFAGIVPPPRLATLTALRDPKNGELIDRALIFWFPAPHSFTGEDVAEFHLHGSRAVIKQMLGLLTALPSIRLAEPGEFTRRAFLHQKMDLTEAEGLADLIDAETEAQKKQALRQMQGELGTLYEQFRQDIVTLLALLEAYIDFPDEEIPDEVLADIHRRARDLESTLTHHLHDDKRGEKIREGIQAVIIGAPNAGKSTLMNYLARRDVAIVSDQAGTTRDALEIHLDIGGFPVTLVDTAGLRESQDHIENEGIRRAKLRADQADLVIALFDATTLPSLDSSTLEWVNERTLTVITKTDLAPKISLPAINGTHPIAISVTEKKNLDLFLLRLEILLGEQFATSSAPLITRPRHRDLLTIARDHLIQFSQGAALELMCEELRLAARAIGKITGRIEVDELLDVIFRQFCIGK